jgi:D-glycero-D-manno-heptose 1,7-bisphosphate phosphatase
VSARPAVFLDRDGTLIEDPGYLHDPEKIVVLPGVQDALLRLRAAGYLLIVITNQSGIGRGYYREEDFAAVMAALDAEFGSPFTAVYRCPHRPDEHCGCRKPETGMLDRAAADHGIDLARSFMVGDRSSDVLAGKNAGCRSILVGDIDAPDEFPRVPGLPEAADLILGGDHE